ncbi:MAG: Holliday junction resolvase RuvX [Verrucomicrobia bacterium]|nr:Holliday junction resolvase RuvX [Verrucomicrobiota bacterium]MBU4430130.1 Holliday junction resolvase RuvX [Verrucomicrobiota bacterium]MCG2680341.1 Holliday junction resolvase RuvX [Kiritimatiellia bacterium]
MTRILGIDYGERRLGFAISDETGIIAMPLCVVTVEHPRHALDEVQRLVREKQAGQVVIGMPLNMNGTRGPASEAVARFVTRLSKTISIPVATWDERLSSKAAERILIDADVRREKRKGVIDQLAAQIMLQSYLDAMAGQSAGNDDKAEL